MAGFLGGAAAGATVTVLIQAVDKTSGVFAGVNKNMLALGAGMVAVGVVGLGVMSGLAKDASNLGESVNAVNVVFGDTADEILKIGESSATSFGMSKQAFNEGAVRFSAFAEVIASDGGNVADVVGKMTGRTADFASVMNIDLAQAQVLMQAGLAGETEGLRRYGIDVSAASIKTYAYANGIGEAGTKLTETQKIMARYGSIMAQTDKTAGDFLNTSDDLANRQRILKAETANLRAELGEALLPALEAVTGAVLIVVRWFSALPGPVKAGVVILGALAAVLLVVAGAIMVVTAASAAFAAVNFWWIGIIALVVAALVGLVAIFKWTAKHWSQITDEYKRLGVIIANVFIGIRNVVVNVWNFIVDFIEKAINGIIGLVNKMINALARIPLIGKLFKNLNIPTVNLEFVKGKEIEFLKAPSSSSSSGATVININGDINGMTGTDIADSLQSELTKKVALS